ncbi:MAG TPA: diffusible signal factor-reguated Ax21 family protein [Thermomonas sp.]|nr:diffusible signal factor-reguated Ax21 family protein [Thermomonas sp.]
MKRSLLALTLLAALPFAASAADGLSYNYVQGGYTHVNSDVNANGWALDGSVAIAPNFHVFGGYNAVEADSIWTPAGTYKPKLDQFKLGLGYNHGISANTDFVGTLAYQKAEAKLAGANADLDGYAAEAGVRSAFGSRVEGYAMAGYEDGNDYDGEAYGRLGGQVKFNANWGVAADVKFADGDTQFFVGPRITW